MTSQFQGCSLFLSPFLIGSLCSSSTKVSRLVGLPKCQFLSLLQRMTSSLICPLPPKLETIASCYIYYYSTDIYRYLFILDASEATDCGVGYYGSSNVHVDDTLYTPFQIPHTLARLLYSFIQKQSLLSSTLEQMQPCEEL